MSTVTELNSLIEELEHIVTLFEDAEDALEVDAAFEELANQTGTINTIIEEAARHAN